LTIGVSNFNISKYKVPIFCGDEARKEVEMSEGIQSDSSKGKKYIASVIKAIEVLELISNSPEGLTLTEICRQMNFGTSATYHLLNTLKHCRMIEQDKRSKCYHVGFEVFRIAEQGKRQNLLGNIAKSHLEQLQQIVHETSSLAILDDIDMRCVEQSEAQRELRMFSKPGVSIPFYCTAGGKLLVSLQPRDCWMNYISRVRFEKCTKNTIVSVDDLVSELEITRERGYGIDNEERAEGIVCIAAPVRDHDGEPIAAISISAPAYRMKDRIDEVAGHVIAAGEELSACIR
jgi:IclR family acetate operon transcriptional repressor